MRFGQTAMVLSFARGRARHVARQLLDLEFRLDLEALTTPAGLRPLRTYEHELRREIARCVRDLERLADTLDLKDALREAIVRTCDCYDARILTRAAPGSDADVSWALSLRELEHALTSRPPAREIIAAVR
ncbi:hypothetical protein [Sandaracinus amylolyticus]|uniref:Uncharacterized protein n=1 Tax=Sandaracinus amylolyticus TaxID=927083 RepID=A0A0F6W4H9_9BACT|nr:hypothetical protein [Sandaracinus amylolyticus]AKF07205.1 hypothetical protein DB32_004354 [Sandaracinus amylolyticus]